MHFRVMHFQAGVSSWGRWRKQAAEDILSPCSEFVDNRRPKFSCPNSLSKTVSNVQDLKDKECRGFTAKWRSWSKTSW